MQRSSLLIAVLALALAGVLPGAAPAAEKAAAKNPASTSVRQVFVQRNPRTLAVLEADFPADYDALMASAERLREVPGTLEDKLGTLFSQLTQVRRQYADRLRFTPVREQRLVVGALGVFLARVQLEAGPEICGRFAQDGSGALFADGQAERFAKLIDQQSAAYFAAVVAAIEDPEIHAPVQQEDWAAVFARMAEEGYPRGFAATIARSAADDPALCAALSAMLHTAVVMDDDGAARFRADFAANATGY